MKIFNRAFTNFLILPSLLLFLCNCQTGYRKEALSSSPKPSLSLLTNNITNELSNDEYASKELIKYELTDDSESFCEAIKKKDDCLNDEPSQL